MEVHKTNMENVIYRKRSKSYENYRFIEHMELYMKCPKISGTIVKILFVRKRMNNALNIEVLGLKLHQRHIKHFLVMENI